MRSPRKHAGFITPTSRSRPNPTLFGSTRANNRRTQTKLFSLKANPLIVDGKDVLLFSSAHGNIQQADCATHEISSFAWNLQNQQSDTPMYFSSISTSTIEEQLAPVYNPTTDIIVFVLGIIPFLWATNEFWRRIAVGEPFGTGQDSVVIANEDSDGNLKEDAVKPKAGSGGRRVLGRGALIVAYVLFAAAGISVALALLSVISSAPPPASVLSSTVDAIADV